MTLYSTVIRARLSKVAESFAGYIQWTAEGPVFYDTQKRRIENSNVESYTVDMAIRSPSQRVPLSRSLFVSPRPVVLVSRPYGEVKDLPKTIMRPPSTHGWYERMVHSQGKQIAMYAVQRIHQRRHQMWLTIFEPETGQILEAHKIRHHEVGALVIPPSRAHSDDLELLPLWNADSVRRLGKIDFETVLNGPPPTWKDIAELTEGIDIQYDKITNMRDVISKMVPDEFSEPVREEIIGALAWLVKNRLTSIDSFDLAGVFANEEVRRTVIEYQYIRYPNGERLAPFAKMMADAVWKFITQDSILETRESRRQAHHFFVRDMLEYIPTDFKELLKMVTRLSRQKRLLRGLPVSREQASKSRADWLMRLMIVRHGLALGGLINYPAIDLTEAIYMGHVHQWPHKYLYWIATLEDIELGSPLSVQINVVPRWLMESLQRTRPSQCRSLEDRHLWSPRWFITDWYTHIENSSRYSPTRGWTTNIDNIIATVDNGIEVDPKKFKNTYNKWRSVPVQELTASEVKTLDYVAAVGLYLVMPEIPGSDTVIGKDWNTMFDEIESLSNRGVLEYWYTLRHRGLVTVMTITYGEAEKVAALSQALLSETPASSVRMERDNRTSIVLSRMSSENARTLIETLPKMSSKDFAISCWPITSWRLYGNNLLQRIYPWNNLPDSDREWLLTLTEQGYR